MIRIRTTLESGQVFTMPFNGVWVTITSYKDPLKKTKSVDAPDFLSAGENHLRYAKALRFQEVIGRKEAEALK